MLADWTTLVGTSAAILTTASYIPQVRKTWSTGETGDLSRNMLLILASGLALSKVNTAARARRQTAHRVPRLLTAPPMPARQETPVRMSARPMKARRTVLRRNKGRVRPPPSKESGTVSRPKPLQKHR
jgi:hypothetical protein